MNSPDTWEHEEQINPLLTDQFRLVNPDNIQVM